MEKSKNLQEMSIDEIEKLHISDVSCSYIDLIGDVALIKREKDRKWAERNELE
jgi:hypothetical protein